MKRIAAVLVVVIGFLALSASASAEVYWKQIDGPLEVEPSELTTSWGTSSSTVRFEDLEWEDWGESEATASGIANLNTCDPFCLAGNYVKVPAKVWLSKIRSVCGQQRYMHIRVAWKYKGKWDGEDYDDVSCRGNMVNPGGRPYPRPPRPPKPRLKRITAKSVFNKTAHEDGRLEYYDKQSLRCHRVNRLRFRCRGRWIERLDIHGEKFVYRVKGRGWVKRSGRYYTCKIRFGYRITTPQGSQRFPSDVEWGFYVVR